MKSCLIKILSVVFITLVVSPVANAKFFSGYSQECYLDDKGNDEYWFCGSQGQSCRGVEVWKRNTVHWNYHGQSMLGGHDKDQGRFWCCGGTLSQAGKYVQGHDWIVKTENVTETLAGGKCTWQRKTNICGDIENPNDKCTEPTGECTSGYVSHNGKCVAACAEGYAFESPTSQNCVSCETTKNQAVVNGYCKKCEINEVLDKNTLKCMSVQEIARTRIQIAPVAHDTCWLCVSPQDLAECLKYVTINGTLDTNKDLKARCSLDSKDLDKKESTD